MIDPYRMIIVNIILSSVLILAYLFYKYIYPKKNPPYLLMIFMLSLLPLISILRKGSYESGDLTLHATRAMSFYNTLVIEHTIPTWSPELNLGYGDTYFQFIYLLPYLIISVFHFIGLTFLASTKLLISLSYILSGLTFYFFAKNKVKEKYALIGAIFYLYAPYRFIDMHFRVSIAENLSFVFIPLVFLISDKYLNQFKNKYLFLLTIVTTLFIITHQIIFISTMGILIVYFFIFWATSKQRKIIYLIKFLFSIALGLLIATFYWLPILIERKYIYQSILTDIIQFTPLKDLLYSPWRYGFLFQGHKGELSFLIGYMHILIILITCFFLYKKRFKLKNFKEVIFFLICSTLIIFMMLSISKPLWQIIPLINNFQFTYRLLAILSFSTAILASFILQNLKNKYLLLIIIFAIFSTMLNWGNRKSIPTLNDNTMYADLINGPTVTGTFEPTTPIWVDPNLLKFEHKPKSNISVIKGNAEIKTIKKNPYKHQYLIKVNEKSIIKENTFYFPGWKLFINNKPTNINYTNEKFSGIITFNLDPGIYLVELIYSQTKTKENAYSISIFSLLVFIILVILNTIKKRK